MRSPAVGVPSPPHSWLAITPVMPDSGVGSAFWETGCSSASSDTVGNACTLRARASSYWASSLRCQTGRIIGSDQLNIVLIDFALIAGGYAVPSESHL
jgi:hypothetical protein